MAANQATALSAAPQHVKVALHGPDASNEMLCSLLAEESLAPKPAAQNSRLTELSRQQWAGLAGGTTDLVIFREL